MSVLIRAGILALGAVLLLVSLFVTIRYGRFYNPFV